MRLRVLALLVPLLALAGLHTPGSVLAASETLISGGNLSQPLRLAQVDETALYQRVSLPPRLDDPPTASGPSYTVKSPYWPKVLPGNGKDRPRALDEAAYFPQGGLVRADQGGKDSWIVLDLRQRAILDRYIRLGEKGLISGDTSVVQVLVAASASGEAVGVTVGSTALSATESSKLLDSLKGLTPSPKLGPGALLAVPPSQPPAGSAWMTFTLPEGREVRLLYTAASRTLVDYDAQNHYPIPSEWLESVLGPQYAPGSPALLAGAVPQEKGPGSPVWWLVMLGGGIALLTAGVYLSRAWARRQPESS